MAIYGNPYLPPNLPFYTSLSTPSQELLGLTGRCLHQKITDAFLLMAIYGNPYLPPNLPFYTSLSTPSQELLGLTGRCLHQKITDAFLLMAIYGNPYFTTKASLLRKPLAFRLVPFKSSYYCYWVVEP